MQTEAQTIAKPGMVVLFGSGETSPSGRRIFDRVLSTLPKSPRISLLETPAGFELNSFQVIGRVGEFLRLNLQNYMPQINIISARAKGTPFSPDEPEIITPMLAADMIFMGPGSPSYAVRQLEGSLAWQMILARHRLGAVLALASAATIAASAYALPVYEIYKVGEDLHWKKGLDLFGNYGLPLVFVPHWNNNDGGKELDTSCSFIGKARLIKLLEMLPPDLTIIGIDEKTALLLDIETGKGEVIGHGGVTIIHTGHFHDHESPADEVTSSEILDFLKTRGAHGHYYKHHAVFPLSECCPFEIPNFPAGLSPEVWNQALETEARLKAEIEAISHNQGDTHLPVEIQNLVDDRQAARDLKDWASADAYRERLAVLGWDVSDTPAGTRVFPKKEEE